MANSLTSLAADIYKAADTVGREQVGFVSSVTLNTDAVMKIALNDTVRSFFTRASLVNTSYTPAMTIPEGDDQTIDNKTMTIAQVANVKIPWTGEDIKHVDNGSGFNLIFQDQIKQAMRGITNKIEGYVATKFASDYSRAWGTAGTTPFASNFNEVANLRKILVDNGTPMDGQVTLVLNSAAGVNMRNLAQLQKVNESGNDQLLRTGELLNLQQIRFKESAGVVTSVAGTGTSYTSTTAGFAIGTTVIPLITGSGTILAGDRVTFAGDTNVYSVEVGNTAPGNITLASPGLKKALAASAVAMTIGAAATVNVAFHKAAGELVVRAPAMPPGGDMATDRMTVQDPFSGLVYELATYKGYGKMMLDITTFYDFKVWKPDFVAALLG
jgi:hypothetical protein